MFGSTDRQSVENRDLAQDDKDAVCFIYPPGNLDQTCDPTPLNGLRLNCETDDADEPIACDEPGVAPGNGSGCSAARAPADAPWVALLASLVGLTAMRRRSSRRDARS